MAQEAVTTYSDDGAIDYTPGSAVTAGDVIVLGGMVAVATNDIAASDLGSLSVCGVKKVPKTTAAWTVGLPVHWDATGDPDGGDAGTGAANQLGIGTYMGIATAAAGSGDDYGYVLLNVKTAAVASSTAAAAGSAQGDATEIGLGFVLATAADGTKGVVLPAAAAGQQVVVKNGAAAILKVYPATSDAINALSANAAISMAANTCAVFTAYDATTWYTTPLLPS